MCLLLDLAGIPGIGRTDGRIELSQDLGMVFGQWIPKIRASPARRLQ